MRIGKREHIRDLNRTLVLNLVRERRAISRAQIARISGLSPSTVTAITASLLAEKLLVEAEPTDGGSPGGGVGRPAMSLRVDPGAGHVVGVKLAPESLTATVTDLDAEPLAMADLPHGTHARPAEVAELFASAVDSLLSQARLSPETLLGIGVGVPGEVHPDTGRVARSPLPEWVDSQLAVTLEDRLGLPVLVDNDVNTLTIAELLFGAGRGLDHLLVVTIGRGIGMGAVVDGIVVRGWKGALGEIGHLQVAPDGRPCWCGRRGCLEAVAAEPAIVREVLAATGVLVTPSELGELAASDERVATILATAGRLVGMAIASASILFDPQRIVVSGEGVRLGAVYLDGLRDGIDRGLEGRDEPDLVIEPWGDEAWARGAASLVLHELFHPAHLRDERRPIREPVTPVSSHPPAVARRGQGGGRT